MLLRLGARGLRRPRRKQDVLPKRRQLVLAAQPKQRQPGLGALLKRRHAELAIRGTGQNVVVRKRNGRLQQQRKLRARQRQLRGRLTAARSRKQQRRQRQLPVLLRKLAQLLKKRLLAPMPMPEAMLLGFLRCLLSRKKLICPVPRQSTA